MSELNIPQDWESKTLLDLATYVNGFPFKPSDWSETGLPIVRIAQITGSSSECDYFQGNIDKAFKLETGDIIFSWSGTLCVVRWRGGPAWLNQHLFRVAPSPAIDNDLFFHLLSYAVEDMGKSAHGSTMKHIKRGELKKYNVVVPSSLKEQQKIAQILDTLDTQIQKTEALIAKLEKIKEGLLHDLLTRGIDHNGQLRPTPEQAPELYKESVLGLIPREWKVCTTGEISQSIVPGRDKPKLSDHGIPWITISDLNKDRVNKSTLGLYVDERQIRTSMIRTIPAGSVIMSCVGEFGITSIAECESIINQQLHCFVVDSGVDADWLMYSLRQKKNTIDRSATQTTIKYLNKTGCESIELPTPPFAEQQAIMGQVSPLAKRIEEEKKYSEKLAKTQNGLMDDLLTGRIRVTPLLKDAV